MKHSRLLFVIPIGLILAAVIIWVRFLASTSTIPVSGGGAEMMELTREPTLPPNETAIVPVACRAKKHLAKAEYIVGRAGAYLKIDAAGKLVQTTGEELASLSTAFDPSANDTEVPLQLECAEDPEAPESDMTYYVSSLKPDQFFSTKRGVRIDLDINDVVQRTFRETIDKSCVVQNEEPGLKQNLACVHPTVFALTDLDHNGKREYWFNEPLKWDNGIGVIEEPNLRLLKSCPGCTESEASSTEDL